jgi:hypothetical protein
MNILYYDLLSDAVKRLVDEFSDKGYSPIMEFKPKADWPREDCTGKTDRYMFACMVKGEWIVATKETPNEAVLEVTSTIMERLYSHDRV